MTLRRSPRSARWKAKFGMMDVSDARKLKTLKTENARLKMLLSLP
jgi:putative transposase